MNKKTEKAIKRLNNHFPLIGQIFRRKGAEALIGTEEKDAVLPLIHALKDEDPLVRGNASRAIYSLKDKIRDHLCSLWEKGRGKEFEEIIVKCRYVASAPLSLMYLTSLKVKEFKKLYEADSKGVDVLLGLLKDRDVDISRNANEVIHSLTNKDGINHICSLWEKGRGKEFEEIIVKCRYVASEPPVLHSQTVFLTEGKLAIPLTEEIQYRCLTDTNNKIIRGMARHLIKLKGNEAYQILWDFVKAHPESYVLTLLKDEKWLPEEPAEQSLFYFLSHDLTAYFDIDFDQSFLMVFYETCEEEVKKAISSRIMKSGDSRLISIIRREGKKRKYTHDEVDLQKGLLIKSRRFEEFFRLLPHAELSQGREIINTLKDKAWQHPDPRLRELQTKLETLFQSMKSYGKDDLPIRATTLLEDFKPMCVGSLKEPEDDKTLIDWTNDNNNFRKRSAAIIYLAEKGSPLLKDFANKACKDPYWQVRMSSAMAEYIKPGTLTKESRALLEKDHVYYVRAAFINITLGRLEDMAVKDIEFLHGKRISSSPDKKPEKPDDFLSLIRGFISTYEREYLLLLAEYFKTDVYVSEEASFEME